MGLDNGIILKQQKKTDPPSYVQIELYKDSEDDVEYEVCYWRKCPGLRANILSVIPPTGEDFASEYELNIATLKKIRDVIYEQLKHPTDWWSPIWSFDEMINHFGRDIVNITWLIDHLRKHPKSIAYFYDSY